MMLKICQPRACLVPVLISTSSYVDCRVGSWVRVGGTGCGMLLLIDWEIYRYGLRRRVKRFFFFSLLFFSFSF